VRGHGRIVAHRTVTVTDDDGRATTLTARHAVVIATGSAALLPDLPGLLDSEPLHSPGAARIVLTTSDSHFGRSRRPSAWSRLRSGARLSTGLDRARSGRITAYATSKLGGPGWRRTASSRHAHQAPT
jgi:hypothetical protein